MQHTLERLRARRQERDGEKGFTLIELLIVIVVLGILAAIVVFAVQNLTGQSSKSACSADLKTTETAAESYKAQMGNYPGPNTETAGAPANAAAAGGALLTGSNVATPPAAAVDSNGHATFNNASPSGPVGPWLKDVPANAGHYTISVANDGSGTISVSTPGGGTSC
jgi:general secretion pathway protein G